MKAFGRAAPTIPLYYYHNVGRVGDMSFDLMQAVGEGVKQIPHKDLKFFLSTEEILIAALTGLDSRAANCALFNFGPVVECYKKMVSFVDQSDLDSAREEQTKIIGESMKHQMSGNYFVSAKKQFNADVKHLGINVGAARPPLCYQYEWFDS
ncbi:unnamed protein product [Oppiella nova]|uniref:Uncharacterized protein n=1 Tax=Oppiella nova TaxID=334625 RepID=A0A7R9QYS7_9ACAR|nr:unnamed protein product [Oppiella nova]CAG2179920.1 unnamed protein product [Oppiella nova]